MGYVSRTQKLANSYILSDTLIASNDALKTMPTLDYTIVKSIKIVIDVWPVCSLRFKFDIASTDGTTKAKVYKNGVAVGVEKSNAGAMATATDDIAFTDLKLNDTLELWGLGHTVISASCQNFRIYGNESPFLNILGA